MKKIITILFALGIAGSASATTYYVATTGNDSCNGTVSAASSTVNLDCSWLTMQKAVETAGDGDTIQVAAGTYNETANNYLYYDQNKTMTFVGTGQVTLATSNTSYAIRLTSSFTAGKVFTFNNIDVLPTGAASNTVLNNGAGNLVFIDNIVNTETNNGRALVVDGGNPAQTITCTRCIVNGQATVAKSTIYTGATFGGWYFTDSHIYGGNYYPVQIGDNTGDDTMGFFYFSGGSISSSLLSASYPKLFAMNATTSFLWIKNATVASNRGALQFNSGVQLGLIEGNTVTVDSATPGIAIAVGVDGTTQPAVPIYRVVVRDNVVRFPATGSHGIMLGTGTNQSLAENNTVVGADIGFVDKGIGNAYINNEVIGPATGTTGGIILKGSTRPLVINNSVYNPSGYGIKISPSDDQTASTTNAVIKNNVFSGSTMSIWDSQLENHDNYIDDNVYTAGTTGVSSIGWWATDDATDLATLQAGWAANGASFSTNDSRSVVTTLASLFLSPSTNLRVFNSSSAKGTKNSSSPDLSVWNDRGAWQTLGGSTAPSRSPINRSSGR